jgi:hypothetical protein
MTRRRFDHLVQEISLALDRHIPRYPLWLTLKDLGMEPDRLSRDAAVAFCNEHLQSFLALLGYELSAREIRRLARTLSHFDPARPTPDELLAES